MIPFGVAALGHRPVHRLLAPSGRRSGEGAAAQPERLTERHSRIGRRPDANGHGAAGTGAPPISRRLDPRLSDQRCRCVQGAVRGAGRAGWLSSARICAGSGSLSYIVR